MYNFILYWLEHAQNYSPVERLSFEGVNMQPVCKAETEIIPALLEHRK